MGIDQPPDEGLVDGSVPLRRARHLLDDHAVTVDHPALGDAGRLVGPLDRAAGVAQDVEGQAELASEPPAEADSVLVHADLHDAGVSSGEDGTSVCAACACQLDLTLAFLGSYRS